MIESVLKHLLEHASNNTIEMNENTKKMERGRKEGEIERVRSAAHEPLVVVEIIQAAHIEITITASCILLTLSYYGYAHVYLHTYIYIYTYRYIAYFKFVYGIAFCVPIDIYSIIHTYRNHATILMDETEFSIWQIYIHWTIISIPRFEENFDS